jgi:hypothetical protein
VPEGNPADPGERFAHVLVRRPGDDSGRGGASASRRVRSRQEGAPMSMPVTALDELWVPKCVLNAGRI